jgi:hypothetical protein
MSRSELGPASYTLGRSTRRPRVPSGSCGERALGSSRVGRSVADCAGPWPPSSPSPRRHGRGSLGRLGPWRQTSSYLRRDPDTRGIGAAFRSRGRCVRACRHPKAFGREMSKAFAETRYVSSRNTHGLMAFPGAPPKASEVFAFPWHCNAWERVAQPKALCGRYISYFHAFPVTHSVMCASLRQCMPKARGSSSCKEERVRCLRRRCLCSGAHDSGLERAADLRLVRRLVRAAIPPSPRPGQSAPAGQHGRARELQTSAQTSGGGAIGSSDSARLRRRTGPTGR